MRLRTLVAILCNPGLRLIHDGQSVQAPSEQTGEQIVLSVNGAKSFHNRVLTNRNIYSMPRSDSEAGNSENHSLVDLDKSLLATNASKVTPIWEFLSMYHYAYPDGFEYRLDAKMACLDKGYKGLCSKAQLKELKPDGCAAGWLSDGAGWWSDRPHRKYGDECGCQGWNSARPRFKKKIGAWCCNAEPQTMCFDGIEFSTTYFGNTQIEGFEKAVRAANLQDCSLQCDLVADGECACFSFNRKEQPANCLLLASCEGKPTQNSLFESGPKRCRGNLSESRPSGTLPSESQPFEGSRSPPSLSEIQENLPCYYDEQEACTSGQSNVELCKCGDWPAPVCMRGQTCDAVSKTCTGNKIGQDVETKVVKQFESTQSNNKRGMDSFENLEDFGVNTKGNLQTKRNNGVAGESSFIQAMAKSTLQGSNQEMQSASSDPRAVDGMNMKFQDDESDYDAGDDEELRQVAQARENATTSNENGTAETESRATFENEAANTSGVEAEPAKKPRRKCNDPTIDHGMNVDDDDQDGYDDDGDGPSVAPDGIGKMINPDYKPEFIEEEYDSYDDDGLREGCEPENETNVSQENGSDTNGVVGTKPKQRTSFNPLPRAPEPFNNQANPAAIGTEPFNFAPTQSQTFAPTIEQTLARTHRTVASREAPPLESDQGTSKRSEEHQLKAARATGETAPTSNTATTAGDKNNALERDVGDGAKVERRVGENNGDTESLAKSSDRKFPHLKAGRPTSGSHT